MRCDVVRSCTSAMMSGTLLVQLLHTNKSHSWKRRVSFRWRVRSQKECAAHEGGYPRAVRPAETLGSLVLFAHRARRTVAVRPPNFRCTALR
eukprot:537808-Rhodomonas_salina.4